MLAGGLAAVDPRYLAGRESWGKVQLTAVGAGAWTLAIQRGLAGSYGVISFRALSSVSAIDTAFPLLDLLSSEAAINA